MVKRKSGKSYLSKRAKKTIEGTNIIPILPVNEEGHLEKYSKTKFLQVYKGYDMLENLFTVRTFIQKQYKIDSYQFEILLKLMGMRVFSRQQYRDIPKPYNYGKFNNIERTGTINLLQDHYDVEKRLYCLNSKGRNIIINFYKYLSGEKRIPEDGVKNVMAKKSTQLAYDKKKMALIKRMNELPVPDHKKYLFDG